MLFRFFSTIFICSFPFLSTLVDVKVRLSTNIIRLLTNYGFLWILIYFQKSIPVIHTNHRMVAVSVLQKEFSQTLVFFFYRFIQPQRKDRFELNPEYETFGKHPYNTQIGNKQGNMLVQFRQICHIHI